MKRGLGSASAKRLLGEVKAEIASKPIARSMPLGFREGHGGDVACPHRDVSCCKACANAHPEIVEVYSQHFWVSDPVERAQLRAELDPDARAEREAERAACRGEFL